MDNNVMNNSASYSNHTNSNDNDFCGLTDTSQNNNLLENIFNGNMNIMIIAILIIFIIFCFNSNNQEKKC